MKENRIYYVVYKNNYQRIFYKFKAIGNTNTKY